MDALTSPEGSLALAIAALLVVLGFRLARPEGALGWLAFIAYALALVASLLAARGLVPGAAPVPPASIRIGGAALLVAGLLLAGTAAKARRLSAPGAGAVTRPPRRARGRVELGLGLVLLGHLLRAPSLAGAIGVAAAVGVLAISGARNDRGRGR